MTTFLMMILLIVLNFRMQKYYTFKDKKRNNMTCFNEFKMSFLSKNF